MTIKELKKLLSGFDENLKVILAVDAEGNGFCPIDSTIEPLDNKAIIIYPEHNMVCEPEELI